MKNIFGFRPGNIHLYKLAFRHRSAKKVVSGISADNERLEYLGDAILDAVVADFLFKTFPTRDEGFLTEMRSKIVSRSQLNKISRKLGLDQLIHVDPEANGHLRSYAGDALEALIGAIYLDKGFAFVRKFLIHTIIDRHFDLDALVNQELSYKSKLIEWAQREKKELRFQVVNEVGNGYKKQYVVDVMIDGKPTARGEHPSIKGAEQLAAEKASALIFGE